jgi:hypothetical protein
MLDQPKPRRLDQPIAVSLDQVFPANNFYMGSGGEARPELRARVDA